jgi:hypothetical protein
MKTYLVAFSRAAYPSPQFCSAVVTVTRTIETASNFSVLTDMASKATNELPEPDYKWMPTSCSLLREQGNDAETFEVNSFELNGVPLVVNNVPSLDTFVGSGKAWFKRNF